MSRSSRLPRWSAGVGQELEQIGVLGGLDALKAFGDADGNFFVEMAIQARECRSRPVRPG